MCPHSSKSCESKKWECDYSNSKSHPLAGHPINLCYRREICTKVAKPVSDEFHSLLLEKAFRKFGTRGQIRVERHFLPRLVITPQTPLHYFLLCFVVVYIFLYFLFFSFYFSRRAVRAKEMELRESNIISPLCSLFFSSAVHYRVSDNSFALQGLGNDCRNIASPAQ